ncbi:hypothetical protein PCANB_001490 [Pneumocystis canis]|nr:hypothetical protein PCANB_001490 [Pneumocystis canis]
MFLMNSIEEKNKLKLEEVKQEKNIIKDDFEIVYTDKGIVLNEKLKKICLSSKNFNKIEKNNELDQIKLISQKKELFESQYKKENRGNLRDYKRVEDLYFLNINKTSISPSNYSEKYSDILPQESFLHHSPSLKANQEIYQHNKTQSIISFSSSSSFYPNHSSDSQISIDTEDFKDNEESVVFKDTICWYKLKKINSHIFTELSRKKFGFPTSIYISDIIAIGTSKGFILIFDYHQTLKHVIGQKTQVMGFGSVTSVSISNDCMFVCSGHSQGYIFVWELRDPTNPIKTISPVLVADARDAFNYGHLNNSKICYISFVNSCHSIVSLDIHGMVFYHILSRNIISNSVLSIRLSGHYLTNFSSYNKKPGITLALSLLGSPGNFLKSMALIVILTTQRLSIISTQPLRIQFKATKPESLKIDRCPLGTLSWVSSDKLKKNDIENIDQNKIRLLYSWVNYLFVLEIHREASGTFNNKDIPFLSCKTVCEWIEKEPVLSTQWFNMNIVILLLKSQKILVMNIETMQSFFSYDISTKKILFMDNFHKELNKNFVGQNHQGNTQIVNVFPQSFFIFKKKFFLLCKDSLYVGIFATWDYKLSSLLNAKEFTKAISLMNLYYEGNCEKTILELPLDDDLRHKLLEEKLLKTINTSLNIILHENSLCRENDIVFGKEIKKELAIVCTEACINMKMVDFLFDDIYNHFQKVKEEEIFFESIETFILTSKLKIIRPDIMKSIITTFFNKGLYLRLENIIFKIDLISLDIDETLKNCYKKKLYNILIYIWTQAFNDFITPIIHFLGLIDSFFQKKNIEINQEQENNIFFSHTDNKDSEINKLFLYLSDSLSGRVYLTGLNMNKDISILAKSSIYWFIFSGTNIIWPRINGVLIKSTIDIFQESTFPYLRSILKYDAFSFLSVLDKAFEDKFLDEIDNTSDFFELSDIKITRQLIVNILLEIMEETPYSKDLVYLYIFISRNISKYPQFIFLSGSILEKILIELAKNSNKNLFHECELSINRLLLFYKPNDTNYLISLYEESKFYKVLKFIYKQEKMFSKLLKIHIEDKNEDELFQSIVELFHQRNKVTNKKVLNIHKIILEYSEEICSINFLKFSQIIDEHFQELHVEILKKLKESIMQYNYLKCLLNPLGNLANKQDVVFKNDITILNNCNNRSWVTNEIQELFIDLLCNFEAKEVLNYLKKISVNDINVENILLILEHYGMIDAIIYLLRLDGKIIIAFEKNLKYITELISKLDISLKNEFEEYMKDTNKLNSDNIRTQLENLKENIITGISLCEEYFFEISSKKYKNSDDSQNFLDSSILTCKNQWIKLLEVVIKISQNTLLKSFDQFLKINLKNSYCDLSKNKSILKISSILKEIQAFTWILVESIFVSLYDLTSLSNSQSIIFFDVLQQFFEIVTLFPSILEFKKLLINIFKNYKYDKKLLTNINKILDKDLFELIEYDERRRKKGWKVQFTNCEICKKDIWDIEDNMNFLYFSRKKYEHDEIWSKKREHLCHLIEKKDKDKLLLCEENIRDGDKLHMKYYSDYSSKNKNLFIKDFSKIIIFTCGHNYHKDCLFRTQMKKNNY